MIRINQLKISVDAPSGEKALYKKAASLLHIRASQIRKLTIVKQSIDARKKPEIYYSYVVDVELAEEGLVRRLRQPGISVVNEVKYRFPECGQETLLHRPVIVGTGPAGLFCGYFLAKAGFCPVLLERGAEKEGCGAVLAGGCVGYCIQCTIR